MAFKTGLEGKPWYVGLGIGLGIGLVLFGAGYWRLLAPLREDYERAEGQLAGLQSKIQEGRAAKRSCRSSARRCGSSSSSSTSSCASCRRGATLRT